MPSATEQTSSNRIETLHVLALCVAALGLMVGLVAQEIAWVSAGVSLILLLPAFRVTTSVIAEARARRFGVAAMGGLVLAIILFSRRIS